MKKSIRTFVMALPIAAFALMPSAAMGQNYSGNWPATVSHSERSNGTCCLTLTDDGTLGWPHSGEATTVQYGNKLFGSFQLIGGLLTVTIQQPRSYADAALVFVAQASDGNIGKGVYDQVYSGEEIDSGVLVYGTKNGCSDSQ